MTYTYKKLKDTEGNEAKIILRKEDNAFIPKDETNKDYKNNSWKF